MKNILAKLNYKVQKRIAIINAEQGFILSISEELRDAVIDQKIDARYPYEFIMIFVKDSREVDAFAPMTLHNLLADGILWFCYPKKSSKVFKSDIDRDHGWKALNDSGFYAIRLVAIDSNWSALRFRNKKYIKSKSEKLGK